MRWILLIIAILPLNIKGAAHLAYTNEAVNYSITNWDGAFDTDRVYFGVGGDSVPLSLTDGAAVNIFSSALTGILLSNPNWRSTNVAISGDVMANTYPAATNVLGFRRPRVFYYGPPRNDANSYINFPLNLWTLSAEPTNNLMVAAARRYGTKLLLGEFIPATSDYHTLVTNYNAKLREWAARSTNADVVTVVRLWDFFKDPGNDNNILSSQTYDGSHFSQLGQTNFCLILTTQVIASICHTAASPSFVNMYLAYTNPPAANNGDRVVVTAGTAALTGSLTVTNAVTFAGEGTNSTILQDNFGAFVLDPVTRMTNRYARFTGFQFAQGTRGGDDTAGMIRLNASNQDGQKVRVDHCFANMLSNSFLAVNGSIGVIDHNTLLGRKQVPLAYHRMGNWNGGAYGDRSYTNLDNFGSAECLVYEDNWISNTLSGFHVTITDGDGGSRVVYRWNVFGKGSIEYHGTESGGRWRGGRLTEFYKNTFRGSGDGSGIALFRSGVHLGYSNDVAGYTVGASIALENNRNDSAYIPFSTGNAERAGADGQNPWDVNVAGGPFATGTVASHNAAVVVGVISSITVAGNPYSVNQFKSNSITRTSGLSITGIVKDGSGNWATVTCTSHGFSSGDIVSIRGADQSGYNTSASVTNTGANTFTFPLDFGAAPATPATGTMYCFQGYYFSEIASNTVNTIYYRNSGQGAAYFLRFTNSPADTFAIWQVDHALDQVGRMGGSLVSGDTPSRPGGWNDQTTSKCYFWENYRESATPIGAAPVHLTIRTNEHYVNGVAKPGYTGLTYPHYLVSGDAPADSGGGGDPVGNGPQQSAKHFQGILLK